MVMVALAAGMCTDGTRAGAGAGVGAAGAGAAGASGAGCQSLGIAGFLPKVWRTGGRNDSCRTTQDSADSQISVPHYMLPNIRTQQVWKDEQRPISKGLKPVSTHVNVL